MTELMYKLTKGLIVIGYPISVLYSLLISLEAEGMFLVTFGGFFIGSTIATTFALLVLKSFGKYLDLE